MWFGLIPGPLKIARALTPHPRRKKARRRPLAITTTNERFVQQAVLYAVAFGILLVLIGMKNQPWVATTGYILIGAAIAVRLGLFYISVTGGTVDPPDSPTAGPPHQPRPVPLPGPEEPLTLSGHKSLRRELPAD